MSVENIAQVDAQLPLPTIAMFDSLKGGSSGMYALKGVHVSCSKMNKHQDMLLESE
jgi:hypothetical protein